ncbi:hypothetical protein COP2_025248 [Malus domestica]
MGAHSANSRLSSNCWAQPAFQHELTEPEEQKAKAEKQKQKSEEGGLRLWVAGKEESRGSLPLRLCESHRRIHCLITVAAEIG